MRISIDLPRRALGIVLALALAIPMWVATPAMAVGEDFVGGPAPADMPLYIPNDHTPQAIRFSASGLEPNTAYEVKIRLSPNENPSGNQNRGFTWNPTSGQWVMNRGPLWGVGNYPTVTTDASGNIAVDKWFYFKFGNENNSGTYYIIVTLNSGGDGSAQNAITKPMVTVLDMKTNGTRIHNGTTDVTNITQDAYRASVTTDTAPDNKTGVFSVVRTEANLVDDDSNGVVDDEDYGPGGARGDFLMTAPAGASVDVFVQSTRKKDNLVLGGPDENIAIDAADTTAPSKPTGLVAVPSNKKMSLSWNASTDNDSVAHYEIYRWQNVNAVEYTAVHSLLATTTATSYEDTTTTLDGEEFNYEVRAVDPSTNVSAASAKVTATAIADAPTVSASVSGTSGSNGWLKKGVIPKVTITSSGTAKYVWNDAGGSYSNYTVPLTVPEGENTLYYYAVDTFGNESDVKQLSVKYDGNAPVPSLTAPRFSTNQSQTSKFTVTWKSSDTVKSSAFETYELEIKGADGTFVMPTAAMSASITGMGGRTYSFRVRAKDKAGNVSAWTSVKKTAVPYDNSSLKFVKSSKWKKSSSSSLYRGSSRYTTTKGAYATMSFKGGKSAYLIATTGPTRGKVKVYVDGKYVKTVSLYSSVTQYRKPILLKSLKGSGTHTVRLVAAPTSTRKRVDIDGLAVER